MTTQQDTTATRITEVKFTWALHRGMWIKHQSGRVEWISHKQGERNYPTDWGRWFQTAYNGGWCGQWHRVG